MSAEAAIKAFLDRSANNQSAFLAELVKIPSDNPPGDCARHAERAADLLEELGYEVERHPVPEGDCRANGMVSCTNLVVRQDFGLGPVIALNAHGDVVAPGAGWSRELDRMIGATGKVAAWRRVCNDGEAAAGRRGCGQWSDWLEMPQLRVKTDR